MTDTARKAPVRPEWAGYDQNEPFQAETSISAHVVRMATITMSFAELDIVRDLLETGQTAQGNTQVAIVREFCRAVDMLR